MQIKEFLPNPVGSDKEGEYIKLFNDSQQPASLSGWIIKDASGKTFKLSGELNSGQELLLKYSDTKVALNNNGEKIFLYDAGGKLTDELGYTGQASEGRVINKKLAIPTPEEVGTPTESVGASHLITNSRLLISKNVIFIDFLTAAILAGLSLYIVLQLEKKLDIKLF